MEKEDSHISYLDVVLTVDSSIWYYGRKCNFSNLEKRKLITFPVSENSTKTAAYARSINEYFAWINSHERDTAKRKKRIFYVDTDLFLA